MADLSRFSSLVWVVCENHGYDQVKDLQSHKRLGAEGAVLSNYFAVTHPSGPNYRSMAAGHTFSPNEELGQKQSTIASYTGIPATVWNFKGPPALRHNPLVDMKSQVATVDELDLEQLPDACMVYVGMDDRNNGHSGPLSVADANLGQLLDRLSASTWWGRPVGGLYPVLFVVWDESYGPENHVFAALWGRGVRAGATSADKLSHFSFCRLVCENWGLSPLLHAADASPISDIWAS